MVRSTEVDVRFLVRLVASAVALWAAAALVEGVTIAEGSGTEQAVTLLFVALIFGVLNATVGAVLKVLSFPLVLVTLGLFLFVINAVMLLLVSAVSSWLGVPFTVESFGAALLGALVVSVVSFLIDVVLPDRYER